MSRSTTPPDPDRLVERRAQPRLVTQQHHVDRRAQLSKAYMSDLVHRLAGPTAVTS